MSKFENSLNRGELSKACLFCKAGYFHASPFPRSCKHELHLAAISVEQMALKYLQPCKDTEEINRFKI